MAGSELILLFSSNFFNFDALLGLPPLDFSRIGLLRGPTLVVSEGNIVY